MRIFNLELWASDPHVGVHESASGPATIVGDRYETQMILGHYLSSGGLSGMSEYHVKHRQQGLDAARAATEVATTPVVEMSLAKRVHNIGNRIIDLARGL